MEISLIRHGRTEANLKRLYCGCTDIPLSAEGISELERLKTEHDYPPLSGKDVYTSGMLRADGTLRTLYGDVGRLVLSGMREMDFGEFEMHCYDELKDDARYIDWITDTSGEYVCPGGESSALFKKRVFEAFDSVIASGRDAVIICHGGVIAEIMARAFPDEGLNFYEWQPSAGRGYTLSFTGGVYCGYRKIP